MYGIPNMKLDKNLVERRVNLLRSEGIEFCVNVKVGEDITSEELKNDFDAIVLACGATQARDLAVEGRDWQGIHFAMEFLLKNTKSLLDSDHEKVEFIDVKDKNVIVIGGGDTGTDCIATSIRQGCRSVTQFEVMAQPIEKVFTHESWLSRVRTFQIDYGQEEAKAIFGEDPREYCILTKKFVGDEQGNLQGLETVEVEWKDGQLIEIERTEK